MFEDYPFNDEESDEEFVEGEQEEPAELEEEEPSEDESADLNGAVTKIYSHPSDSSKKMLLVEVAAAAGLTKGPCTITQ